MHPILFHLGHIAVSTEGVLVAFGLLVGLQFASSLGTRYGIDPDRIWNLGLIALLTLFASARILVILFNLRDFAAHPFWMLGLTTVRDERYFYGGVALAICAGAGYITAWRLPWRAMLDTLAPGAGVVLACASLGSLAAGADFGRPATAAWGVIYSSRIAARASGTPLGIPLVPTALYAALLHLLFAAMSGWLVLRSRSAGDAAAAWLFAAGLSTVMLAQLRYRFPGEMLVFNLFTPAQALGIVAVGVSCMLSLSRVAALEKAGGANATIGHG